MTCRELHREAAELRSERNVCAEDFEVFSADDGDVHRVRYQSALERSGDLLRDDDPGPVLRFFGRGREVGRDDDVVELEQRAGVRLRGEDVECGAADLAALESFEERVLVDQLATCSVYDPDTVPHLRER